MKWSRTPNGTIRYRQKFAFWPTKMEGADYLNTVWLEKYWVREIYARDYFGPFEYSWRATIKTQDYATIEYHKNDDNRHDNYQIS